MSWIKVIDYEAADSSLRKTYDRVKGPDNNIDNVLLIHSLRPHTLVGHMTLYKSVLHHSKNTLPKWYLEALGVYVSFLNHCEYCFEHHLIGFKRHYNDPIRAELYQAAVLKNDLASFFDGKYLAGCLYAKALTETPNEISENDIQVLREAGLDDGEILEVNQVTSYFNYVNRMVVGLGVNTKGDIIGLSPTNSEDPNDWNHQ